MGQLQILAGHQEPVLVSCQRAAQPSRAWVGADEHEQRVRGDPTRGAVDRDGVQRFVPVQLADPGAEVDVDRRMRLYAVQEVARHGRGQIAPACDEMDLTAAAGEEDGGLSRRVRPSYNHHRLALAGLCLDFGCGV
jgi:hypothetical protein